MSAVLSIVIRLKIQTKSSHKIHRSRLLRLDFVNLKSWIAINVPVPAVGDRADIRSAPEHGAEIPRIAETALCRYLSDRKCAVKKQSAGVFEPEFGKMVVGAGVHGTAEKSAEMLGRNACKFGKITHGDVFGKMVVHVF